MASFLKVHHPPLVYTYTEWSIGPGKNLLKGSILSARAAFGLAVEIHILYHGEEDITFLTWLKEKSVVIHNHNPKWIPLIESLREITIQHRFNSYSYSGNYFGSWQRIDIPLFINTEYALLLDADTVIHESFNLADFGLDITPVIAFSAEFHENKLMPTNAGVTLMNIPKLRQTYQDFLRFIENYAKENKDFGIGPGHRVAYLEFFGKDVLPAKFNVKPYYTSRNVWGDRKIVHFNWMKPHDIMNGLKGKRFEGYPKEVVSVLEGVFRNLNTYPLCLSLRDFSIAMIQDKENLKEYCELSFEGGEKSLQNVSACNKFYEELSQMPEGEDCLKVMKSFGFSVHETM